MDVPVKDIVNIAVTWKFHKGFIAHFNNDKKKQQFNARTEQFHSKSYRWTPEMVKLHHRCNHFSVRWYSYRRTYFFTVMFDFYGYNQAVIRHQR